MSEHYEVVCDSSDRPLWLRARRTGVGASDSPAILSASPYASPVSVFAEKIDAGDPVDEDNERMEWGRILEPVILGWFEGVTGRDVEPAGKLLRSMRWPFMLATLDGWQYSGAAIHENVRREPVEVKNTQARTGWSDGVPRHVWIQIQHQLCVTGSEMGSVAVLLCGCEFKWRDVERDDKFIDEMLLPECEAFWKRVENGGPPPMADGNPATAKALARIYPQDDGETVALSGEITNYHGALKLIKDQEKTLKESRAGLENQIKAAIGSATFGALQCGGSYSYRTAKNGVRTLRAPRED